MAVSESHHKLNSTSWLRAAVLGANDGVISVASIVMGVAAGSPSRSAIVLSGIAGLCAGAVSMAAGEYVSVQSQADTELAELERERLELEREPHAELLELAFIYEERGLDPALARQVAEQLTTKDALSAHVRDELGITDFSRARPLQAAIASALSFGVGGAVPLVATTSFSTTALKYAVPSMTLVALSVLGSLAAHVGGASRVKGAIRVVVWGALAMAFSAIVGGLVGATI